MPKTSVGIRINSSRATVVRLKGGFRSTVVDVVETLTASPSEDLLSGWAPPACDTVVTSLGADAIFLRVVEVPFTDKRRALQTAPLEAEDTLPITLENLLTASQYLYKTPKGAKVLVAATRDERVSSLKDRLTLKGAAPAIIESDPTALMTLHAAIHPEGGNHLIIEVDEELSQGVLLTKEEGYKEQLVLPGVKEDLSEFVGELSRALTLWSASGFRPDNIFLSGPGSLSLDINVISDGVDCPVSLLPLPPMVEVGSDKFRASWPSWSIPLGLALRETGIKNGSQINLLTGDMAPAGSTLPKKRNLITAGVYVALLAILWGATVWMETSDKESELKNLNGRVRSAFTQALPEVTNIVDEVNQLSTRVKALEERAAALGSILDRDLSPLSLLKELSARIPQDIEVELRDFQAEPGRLRIEGSTDSFDSIDKVKAQLEGYDRFTSVAVTDAKAGVTADAVIFKMTILYEGGAK
ncbi:MAG: hypothetical protein C0609_07660 [Deltaproteobacteria bacterium]|nr:MAG: hypothetical protein C0609_07660 [Deltaproteobacteria bacterium]